MVVKKIESKETEANDFNVVRERLDYIMHLDNQLTLELLKSKQLLQRIQERDIFDIIERVLALQKQLQPPKREESADIRWIIELIKDEGVENDS